MEKKNINLEDRNVMRKQEKRNIIKRILCKIESESLKKLVCCRMVPKPLSNIDL